MCRFSSTYVVVSTSLVLMAVLGAVVFKLTGFTLDDISMLTFGIATADTGSAGFNRSLVGPGLKPFRETCGLMAVFCPP